MGNEIKTLLARIESALESLVYLAPEDTAARHVHQRTVAKALNEIATLAGLAPVTLGAKELPPC